MGSERAPARDDPRPFVGIQKATLFGAVRALEEPHRRILTLTTSRWSPGGLRRAFSVEWLLVLAGRIYLAAHVLQTTQGITNA